MYICTSFNIKSFVVMAIITLEYNGQDGSIKKVLEGLISSGIFREVKSEKSPYNKAFINKIQNAEHNIKEGKTKKIDPDNLWESLK